ncbi:MAG: type II toxin-antitoxin system VapC family toxin [Pedobacter sp.]|nr:MAG: type II toxin-antitoxin system VapC family toxin [Pedobacter sp.]
MSGNILLDTNIIIYLSKKILTPEKVFSPNAVYAISVISKMELLGYHFQNKGDEQFLHDIIDSLIVIPLTEDIVSLTFALRKHSKIKLPDAIIYATAQKLNAKFLTNNVSDFEKIAGTVEIINPMVA